MQTWGRMRTCCWKIWFCSCCSCWSCVNFICCSSSSCELSAVLGDWLAGFWPCPADEEEFWESCCCCTMLFSRPCIWIKLLMRPMVSCGLEPRDKAGLETGGLPGTEICEFWSCWGRKDENESLDDAWSMERSDVGRSRSDNVMYISQDKQSTRILCIITLDTSHPSKVNSRLPPHNHAKTKDSMESAPQGFRSNIEPERIRNLAKKKGGMTHGFCQKRLTILRKDRRYEEWIWVLDRGPLSTRSDRCKAQLLMLAFQEGNLH